MGITAASIPALRPGYRVVSTYISTYYSLHYGSGISSKPSGQRKPSDESDDTLVARGAQPGRRTEDLEEQADLAQKLTHPGRVVPYDSAAHGAAHMASVQVDRAAEIGTGVEGFPMREMKGDVGTMEQGIKKTMWFGTESEPEESQTRSFGAGDLERGENGKRFV